MDRFFILLFTISVLNNFVTESVSMDDENKYARPGPAIEIVTHYGAEERILESVFLNEIKRTNQEQVFFYQTHASLCDMEDSFNVSVKLCQRITAGTMTVLGTHKYSSIDVFKSYSSVSQVPFVTTGIAENTTGQELGYTIYLRPLYAKAIADVVKHFGWTELYYIYNTNDGLKRWEQLVEALEINRQVVKTSLQLVRDGSDALMQLQRLEQKGKDLGSKHILLDLPATDCSHVLQEQFNRKTGLSHDYFIVNLVDLDPDLGGRAGMNVITFRLVTEDANSIKQFRAAYKNTNQNLAKELSDAALAADAVKVVTEGVKRAAALTPSMANYSLPEGGVDVERPDCLNDSIQRFPYGRQIIKAIKEVEFHGLSGKVKFDKFGLRCDYQLHLFQSTAIGGLSNIGHWHSESGLHIEHSDLTGTKVDRHLIITSILSSPYLWVRDDASLTGNDRFEGYMVDLIEQVSAIAGFKYTISPVKDNKYGSRDESTGSWNGMIGEILRNEADITVAPLTITSEREKIVDFTSPFMTLGISIMMKKSASDGNSYPSFLSYFSADVWVCIFLSYLATCIVHLIVTCVSSCRVENKENDRVSWRRGIALDSLCFCFTTFRQQHKRPKPVAARIAGYSWAMLVLLLTCFYTAQMIRVLVKERPPQISSVEDLAGQNTVKYGIINSGSTLDFFRRSTVHTYEKMWAVMRTADPPVMVNTLQQGVERVRQDEKYAFITESTTIEYINSLPPCETIKVGGNLDSKGYGMATKQGSPLRDRLDMALSELNERQELTRLKQKWFGSRDCGSVKKSNSKVHQKFSIFYCLLCALGVALSILACEYLKKTWKKGGPKKEVSAPDEDEQGCSQL